MSYFLQFSQKTEEDILFHKKPLNKQNDETSSITR
jgi:hypothetical protein